MIINTKICLEKICWICCHKDWLFFFISFASWFNMLSSLSAFFCSLSLSKKKSSFLSEVFLDDKDCLVTCCFSSAANLIYLESLLFFLILLSLSSSFSSFSINGCCALLAYLSWFNRFTIEVFECPGIQSAMFKTNIRTAKIASLSR